MGTDADDNLWPQGKGTSAVTANIIQHQFGYGSVARRHRVIPKIVDNRPNSTRMASNPWKIGQMLRQTEKDLEKAKAYATFSLRRNPSGGCQFNGGSSRDTAFSLVEVYNFSWDAICALVRKATMDV